MRGKTEIVECIGCQNHFLALSIRIRAGSGKYCSVQCYNNYRAKNKKDENYLNKLYQKKHKYNIDENQYLKLMSITNCQICNRKFDKDRDKCIDHCHITGKIRGILCNNCNKALGLFLDNTSNLQSAIQYLKG